MTTNENQSWTQDENTSPNVTEGQGSVTEYGVHGFNRLPQFVQNEALSAYVKALANGWKIPEAQVMAREAVQRAQLATTPGPHDEEIAQRLQNGFETQYVGKDDQADPIQETHATMPKIAKALFWAAGLMAVAYFALQGFLGPATPLQAAIDARAAIAQDLAVATAKADASEKVAKADAKARDVLRARYELAYKREACLVNGSCK